MLLMERQCQEDSKVVAKMLNTPRQLSALTLCPPDKNICPSVQSNHDPVLMVSLVSVAEVDMMTRFWSVAG